MLFSKGCSFICVGRDTVSLSISLMKSFDSNCNDYMSLSFLHSLVNLVTAIFPKIRSDVYSWAWCFVVLLFFVKYFSDSIIYIVCTCVYDDYMCAWCVMATHNHVSACISDMPLIFPSFLISNVNFTNLFGTYLYILLALYVFTAALKINS